MNVAIFKLRSQWLKNGRQMDIMEKTVEQREIGSDEKSHVRRKRREKQLRAGGREKKIRVARESRFY